MTIADDNAKVLSHYLEREAQRVGGSRLRPWQAIGVQDENGGGGNPPCSDGGLPCVTGDRLTFAFAVAGFVPESCAIERMQSADMRTGRLKFKKEFDIAGNKVCCMHVRQGESGPVEMAPADLINTHVIVSSGLKHFAVTVTGVNGDCDFAWVRSGQVVPLSSGAVSESDFDRVEGAPPERVTGFAVPVEVATFFVGCAKAGGCGADKPEDRALFLFSDRNAGSAGFGAIVADDTDRFELITAGVLDFQVNVLADIDGDGDVDELSAPAADEVFGNSPADSDNSGNIWMKAGVPVNLAGKMRGLRFEIITGVMTHDPAFAGEEARQLSIQRVPPLQKAGMHVRRMSVAAAFRNLNILK